jgi:flagellar basal body-associated protein FliL
MAKKAKAADDDGAKKKSPKKMAIIGVVVLAGAWKMGVLPIGGAKADPNAASTTTTTTEAIPGEVVAIGEAQTVDLADTDVAHFARFQAALVLNGHIEEPAAAEGPETESPYADRFGAIQALLVETIRSKTYAELRAPDALETLRLTLEPQIEEIYAEEGTDGSTEPNTDVYGIAFTEFVVQ